MSEVEKTRWATITSLLTVVFAAFGFRYFEPNQTPVNKQPGTEKKPEVKDTKNEEKIVKLEIENKALTESHEQTLTDLQSQEEKVNDLQKTSAKLEAKVDGLEITLGAERTTRIALEEAKRKLEDDLRLSKENIMDLENEKAANEEKLKKSEFNLDQMNAKFADEQVRTNQLQKEIKELKGRTEEVEEELENDGNTHEMDREFQLLVVPFGKNVEMELATVAHVTKNGSWKLQIEQWAIASLADGKCDGKGYGHKIFKDKFKQYGHKVVVEYVK